MRIVSSTLPRDGLTTRTLCRVDDLRLIVLHHTFLDVFREDPARPKKN
jgi:hypothetical protein